MVQVSTDVIRLPVIGRGTISTVVNRNDESWDLEYANAIKNSILSGLGASKITINYDGTECHERLLPLFELPVELLFDEKAVAKAYFGNSFYSPTYRRNLPNAFFFEINPIDGGHVPTPAGGIPIALVDTRDDSLHWDSLSYRTKIGNTPVHYAVEVPVLFPNIIRYFELLIGQDVVNAIETLSRELVKS